MPVQGIRTTEATYTGPKVEKVEADEESRVWLEMGLSSVNTGVMLSKVCLRCALLGA
jgi:hypothetical protein